MSTGFTVEHEGTSHQAGPRKVSTTLYNQVLASAIGGCLVTITLNPILILKVHLQRSDKTLRGGLTESALTPTANVRSGSDIYAISMSIWKKKG